MLLAAAVSASVYVNNGNDSMDELFNANVEALTQWEDDVDNWWVNDDDPDAYICTPGGPESC